MSSSEKYLIPVGFYREFRGGQPHEPSVRDAVQTDAAPHEAEILRYLGAGEALITTSSLVADVLDPEFGIIGPPHILTDGIYAWPAILPHYVKRYHVRLSEEFVLHMSANNWSIPSSINFNGLKIDRRRPL